MQILQGRISKASSKAHKECQASLQGLGLFASEGQKVRMLIVTCMNLCMTLVKYLCTCTLKLFPRFMTGVGR